MTAVFPVSLLDIVSLRREMSPQVKQPVSARRYFPQDLLGRESYKKLVRPVELCLPYLQPESHIRVFVCHSFISSTLRQVRRVETQVIGSQGAPVLLLVIVMLVHDPRPVPFPEGPPTHRARPARHDEHVPPPPRMRVTRNISRNRG